jgi:hypothetical protein
MFEGGMWVIYLEMGLALGLLGFIVWYTLPSKKPPTPLRGKRAKTERNVAASTTEKK